MQNRFFNDITDPKMVELVNWFQIEFSGLAVEMKYSDHHAHPAEPNPYHVESSVWSHTMMVCKEAQGDNKIVKISALLHDLGKPLALEVIPFNTPKPTFNGGERISAPLEDTGRQFKTHQRGHEGISFWLAIDPLYSLKRIGVIDEDEMNEILFIISLHGTLFNRIKDGVEHKPKLVVNMFKDYSVYENFVKQVKNDSLGRFYLSKEDRADTAKFLGDSLYGKKAWYGNMKFREKITDRNITVLVGLPASGKSTWLKENQNENTEIISKDLVILEMGKEIGVENYTDIYKALSDEQHKEAYTRTMDNFRKAVEGQKDIVIDMTNMSKKSRGKWINNLKANWDIRCKVFLAGKSLLQTRNLMRSQEENKHIPEHVFKNMMKTFLVPTYNEFDSIEFIHQDER